MIADEKQKQRLLTAVGAERQNAIGFGDGELKADREKALEYFKGKMSDVPAVKNQSKVVSSEVADTIETILPDLLEIFTGGEDVVTFKPNGPDDVEQVRLETDVVADVFFSENRGYSILEDCLLNALLVKNGIFHWYWDEQEKVEEQRWQGMAPIDMQMLVAEGWEVTEYDEATGETVATKTVTKGKPVVEAWAPEDFATAPDTDYLPDATYCVGRSYPRAQDLIQRGYDEKKVGKLTEHATDDIGAARDTAGEGDNSTNETDKSLRIVEIYTHYLRLDGKLHRLVTGNDEAVLLDHAEVKTINFSSITPFRIPGRFTGLSMADKAMEPQRISTGLMRGLLNGVYFSQNQRQEVSEEQASENTIADLLRNEPGSPVRSKSGTALRPLTNPGPGFDYPGALELTAIMNERRTGVQRGQQGLNPDTLHDTASGAKIMLTEGQKRTRRIARSFAETGIKEMFKGLHALLRENSKEPVAKQIQGKWVEITPSDWPSREDMTIEIGVGSGGRDQEIAVMREIMQLQAQAMESGSGLVTQENIFNSAKRFMERAGIKAPENYISNPAEQEPQEQGPSPEELKIQAEQQKAQAEMQMKQAELELKREEMQLNHQLAIEKAKAEIDLAREKMAMEFQANQQRWSLDIPANRPGGSLAA